MKGTNEEFFVCTCGCTAISVERYNWDEGDEDISIVIWAHGRERDYNWRWRLEAIWKIIRKGFAADDEVILKRADAVRMADKLREWTKADEESAYGTTASIGG